MKRTTSATGSLTVSSVPTNASLYIDNVYKGITPSTISGLTVGYHAIKITKSGYSTYSAKKYIYSGSNSVYATLSALDQTKTTSSSTSDGGGSGSLTTSSIPAPYPVNTLGGTSGYIPKFLSNDRIGNSVIYENNSNVGIGTTNPQTKLDIYGNQQNVFGTRIQNDGGGAQLALYNNGRHNVFLEMRSTNVSSPFSGLTGVASLVSNRPIEVGTSFAHPIVFGTNGTEVMRIDSSGRIGIGTDSPQATLDVNGDVHVKSGVNVNIGDGSPLSFLTVRGDISGRFIFGRYGRFGDNLEVREYIKVGDHFETRVDRKPYLRLTGSGNSSPSIELTTRYDSQNKSLPAKLGTLNFVFNNNSMPSVLASISGGLDGNITIISNYVTLQSLLGLGNAYVCVDGSGKLFRSLTACM